MSEILEATGSAGMAIVGLGGLGVLVALGLAGLAFTKRRVPLAAWLFVPILICIVGALGAWSASGSVFAELGSAEAEQLNSTALAGLWQALTIDMLARWAAALVLVVCTWCAAVGAAIAVGPSEETRLTPIAAGSAALFSILGVVVIGGMAVQRGLGTSAMLLAAIVLIGGLGVAFGSSRRALYEHAERVAGMRLTAAACYFFAVAYAGRAVAMGSQIDMFGPNGKATDAELIEAVRMWAEVADPVWTISWLALAFAAVTAFAGVFSELGDAVQRFTLIDFGAALVLVGMLATVRVVEENRTNVLAAVGTHEPARLIFDDWGPDLPSAVFSVDKKPIDGNPSNGGYGDVLTFDEYPMSFDEKGNPIMKKEWRRTWAWNGSGWAADDSPLDCEGHPAGCQVPTINTARPPLLAINKGESGSSLLEAARTLPGKEFLLLLRKTDMEENLVVPSQIAHKQLGFLPISVEAELDFEKQVWADAGKKELFWGPTHWFGTTEDEELDSLPYGTVVFAGTEADGMQVAVSERARVEGIASSCLMARNRFENGAAMAASTPCSIAEGDVNEWRVQAREVWEVPEPETVDIKINVEGPEGDLVEPLDLEQFATAFAYENDAIANCQANAHDKALEDYDPEDPESELAPTSGKLFFEVVINDRGRVNGTYVDTDKSKFDNRALTGCIAERYRRLSFDPLPKRPKAEEGEEQLPDPKVSVFLAYDFEKLPEE